MGEESSSNPRATQFTAENVTAEDLLKAQTTGLVTLSDFRKRRAEVLEQVGRETTASGTDTPTDRSVDISSPPALFSHEASEQTLPRIKKKKKKPAAKAKLSFGSDQEDDDVASSRPLAPKRAGGNASLSTQGDTNKDSNILDAPRHRLVPNARFADMPRAKTKATLAKEAILREQLKADFHKVQAIVKATEIKIRFTFYDGADTPGGIVRVKKGDLIWLFLDRARKVGAHMTSGDRTLREWARISVDDLMMIRDGIIVPHHYEIYYFIVQKARGFKGEILFDYSAEPTTMMSEAQDTDNDSANSSYNPLSRPGKKPTQAHGADEDLLEGGDIPASKTRVVDRRWYEKNKHLYPANTWAAFDPEKDYSSNVRTDAEGNRFFFS